MPPDRPVKIHQILIPLRKRRVHLSDAPERPRRPNLDLLPLPRLLCRIQPSSSSSSFPFLPSAALRLRGPVQGVRRHRHQMVRTSELKRPLLAEDDPFEIRRRGFAGG